MFPNIFPIMHVLRTICYGVSLKKPGGFFPEKKQKARRVAPVEIIPNIYKRGVVSDDSGPIFTVDASLVKLKKMDARLPELNLNVYISRT